LKVLLVRAISAALLLVVLCIGISAQTGPKAPPLKLRDLQGRALRLRDYKGKVVLVNFWATWCPPCRTEMPELMKWQREYRTRGLQIIGITYPPHSLKEVRRFVRSLRVNYPVAVGTKATKLLFTASETLPLTVIINRAGNVSEVIEGVVFPEEFDAKIKPLLEMDQTRRGFRRVSRVGKQTRAAAMRETGSRVKQSRTSRVFSLVLPQ
jgi:thiol-disulfide isomerase/thioredoxin